MKTKNVKNKAITKKKIKRKSINTLKISEDRLKLLYGKGMTNKEIAQLFSISVDSLSIYLSKHPKLKERIQTWKERSDELIEKSLRDLAIGYDYDEVKVEETKLGKRTTTTNKKVIQNINAIKFWLTNRKKKEWKERLEVVGDGDGSLIKMGDIIINGKKKDFEVGGK